MPAHLQRGEAHCDRPWRQLLALTPQESKAGWKEGVRAGGAERVGEPGQSLIEPIPAGGTGGLNVPVAVTQGMQAQLVCDLSSVHSIRQILEHEGDTQKGGSGSFKSFYSTHLPKRCVPAPSPLPSL